MDPGREWQEVRKGARNTEKLPMHGPLTMGREQSERGTIQHLSEGCPPGLVQLKCPGAPSTPVSSPGHHSAPHPALPHGLCSTHPAHRHTDTP